MLKNFVKEEWNNESVWDKGFHDRLARDELLGGRTAH
jgi:hypothetical protein